MIWWNHSRTWGSWGFFFKNFLFFPTRRSLDRISMESGNARWGGKVSSVLWSSSISYKVLLSALPGHGGEKTFRAIPPGDGKVCPAIKYLDTVINSAGGMWFLIFFIYAFFENYWWWLRMTNDDGNNQATVCYQPLVGTTTTSMAAQPISGQSSQSSLQKSLRSRWPMLKLQANDLTRLLTSLSKKNTISRLSVHFQAVHRPCCVWLSQTAVEACSI